MSLRRLILIDKHERNTHILLGALSGVFWVSVMFGVLWFFVSAIQ